MDFTYDPGLVALSIAAAILGSFTGLVLTVGLRAVGPLEAGLRIVLGGLGIGGGIWSMHFIAMLAVELPVALNYSIPETLTSALLAVSFTAVALWIVAFRKLGAMSLPLSALFLGSGIGTMHYLGMNAIRGCAVKYSAAGVALSLLIAVTASAVALWFTFRRRGVLDTFLGAAALGLAISSMHYVAMESTRFLRPSGLSGLAGLFSEPMLALTVALSLYSICSVCLIVFAVLTFYRKPALRH